MIPPDLRQVSYKRTILFSVDISSNYLSKLATLLVVVFFMVISSSVCPDVTSIRKHRLVSRGRSGRRNFHIPWTAFHDPTIWSPWSTPNFHALLHLLPSTPWPGHDSGPKNEKNSQTPNHFLHHILKPNLQSRKPPDEWGKWQLSPAIFSSNVNEWLRHSFQSGSREFSFSAFSLRVSDATLVGGQLCSFL